MLYNRIKRKTRSSNLKPPCSIHPKCAQLCLYSIEHRQTGITVIFIQYNYRATYSIHAFPKTDALSERSVVYYIHTGTRTKVSRFYHCLY